MRLLFVIFVLSVAALIWTALGMARHIRRHQLASTSPKKPAVAETYLEGSTSDEAEDFVPAGVRKHS
jgi:hypothetical protein